MFSDRSRQEHYSSRRPYNVGQLTLTENWKSLFARKAPVWKMGRKLYEVQDAKKTGLYSFFLNVPLARIKKERAS